MHARVDVGHEGVKVDAALAARAARPRRRGPSAASCRARPRRGYRGRAAARSAWRRSGGRGRSGAAPAGSRRALAARRSRRAASSACAASASRRPSATSVRSDRAWKGSSRRHRHSMGLMPCPKRRQNLVEKARRQVAVVAAIRARRLAQFVARPDELIAFAHDDP